MRHGLARLRFAWPLAMPALAQMEAPHPSLALVSLHYISNFQIHTTTTMERAGLIIAMHRLSMAVTGVDPKAPGNSCVDIKARKARLRELLHGLIPLGRNDITPPEIKQRADIIAQLQGKTQSDMTINAAMRFFWLADTNHDYELTLDEWVDAFLERFKCIDEDSWRKEQLLLEHAGIVSRTILALSNACVAHNTPDANLNVMEIVITKDRKLRMQILSNVAQYFTDASDTLINYKPAASMSLQATSLSSGMNSDKGCKSTFNGMHNGSVVINQLLSSPQVHGRSVYWEEALQIYLTDAVTKMRIVYATDGSDVESIHVYAPLLLVLNEDTSVCSRTLQLMHGQQWTWPLKEAYNECELCKLRHGKMTGDVLFHKKYVSGF